MRIRLPADDEKRLNQLTEAASSATGRAVSGSSWLRGAVQVALSDEAVASRIAAAVPETNHGGPRPGAGRPKGSTGGARPGQAVSD